MGGDITSVPDEFAAANDHALLGHIGEAELEPNVPQVHDIEERAENSNNGD